MSVRVAIPILYATIKLHIEKGRQWNIIEHLLLHRLVEGPATAATLSQDSTLPWRLVVEVMIRLMRVGWVELHALDGETSFRITQVGSAVAELESLPKVTRPLSKHASFAVDKVSGTVFRSREFPNLYTSNRLNKLMEGVDVRVLAPTSDLPKPKPAKVIETLLDEDEECRAIDASGARSVDRFAVVTVVGATIDGLPQRASPQLKRAIMQAAASPESGALDEASVETTPHTTSIASEVFNNVIFNHDDLIVGGSEHKVMFERILRRASSRIVIHSTFIDPQRFRSHLPLIEAAAKKGVRVDILWGKSDDDEGKNATAEAASACRAMLLNDVVRERVHLHGVSTDSHAKIILADNGDKSYTALLGSCNWLSSGFNSFEATVLLREPKVVAEIAGTLSAMTLGSGGAWMPITRELASLSSSIKNGKRPKTGGTVKMSLVFGSEHGAYVRRARDDAKSTITVGSHRFSANAEPLVLVPLEAAAKAKGIEVSMFYGRVDGHDGGTRAVNLSFNAQTNGLKVHQILDPRLHAKILAWDDDNVVVTSLNWLSADPPQTAPYSEIGIHIAGPGVARELVSRMKVALVGI